MHNSSCSPSFLRFIGQEIPGEPLHLSYHGGQVEKEAAVMFLLRLSTFLGFFLIVVQFISFLLTKLFTFLLEKATAPSLEPRNSLLGIEEENKWTAGERYLDHEEFVGIFSREEGLLFLYNESDVKDTLLVKEENDFNQQRLLEVDESSVTESPYNSPLNYNEQLRIDRHVNIPVTDSDFPPAIVCGHGKDEDLGGETCDSNESKEEMAVAVFSENEKRLTVVDQARCDSKELEQEDVNEALGGSVTGESSKSSAEWRNCTISRSSDTECPLSSSSRRSSSNWETYSLFRKYDEEMMFFDRISAQKLVETGSTLLCFLQLTSLEIVPHGPWLMSTNPFSESSGSIKFLPRSMSQRIVSKFTIQKQRKKNKGGRDPYQDLESAYVAQICLAWEALNWNYNNFQQRNANRVDSGRFFCTAWIAQQFQQFQVLLQRFIENEPYERGRRPEVFARMRICSPKLLQVPELQEAGEGGEDMVSSTEFLSILEEAIRTFMNFLKADKKNPCQMLKAGIKRNSSSVDPDFLHLLKRANRKKKTRLKDMLKRRKCLENKWEKGEEEMEILMGLIDMKIVSRTLRMPEISQEQLHWCEEKMTKVRLWDGKVQRDSSTLFALFAVSNIGVVV
ncbi:hypothetical protein Cni_G11562 [Canna indica]|uniref:Ribosomal protein L34Ae n=1 Tax=Canna indica TaxID=4628 RepID=A0AAQ3K901_9LILI|nr:hypothetical protein Cni_G11562 [Canna indica]